MKTLFNKILLIIIAIICLTSFIWLRFLRERLPREIPFTLSEFGFILLLGICGVYLYLLTSLIFKKESSPRIAKLISYIYIPLETLDHFLKDLPIINSYYKHFIVYIVYKLNPLFINGVYYYSLAIFPRFILITTLFLDTFYLHKLNFIYKVIFIGLILFLNRYIIYSLKYAKEHFIVQLEPLITNIATDYVEGVVPEEDVDDDDDMLLSLRKFVEFQTNSIYFDSNKRAFAPVGYEKYTLIYCSKHHILENQLKGAPISHDIINKVNNIVQISVLLQYYELYDKVVDHVKALKIIIFNNYFMCWLYILIVSFHTLPLDSFNYIIFLDTIEMFSEVPIEIYLNESVYP